MLNEQNLILKEELNNVKEEWSKMEKSNKDVIHMRMTPLSYKEDICKEVNKTLWESQNFLETTK